MRLLEQLFVLLNIEFVYNIPKDSAPTIEFQVFPRS
jgi:hypothetical protein